MPRRKDQVASWATADITVNFQGTNYIVPAWSVSILPDCKNVVHNTTTNNYYQKIILLIIAKPLIIFFPLFVNS